MSSFVFKSSGRQTVKQILAFFIVSVIGAVAIMGLGIVMIAAQVEDVAVAQRVIGGFLVLNGLANIWYIVQLRKQMKEKEKAHKDEGR